MSDSIDIQNVIVDLYNSISSEINEGEVANYIPELAKANPDNFGICVRTICGKEFGVGDWQTKFSLQSIAKVLSLTMAYRIQGNDIWQRLGVEPSGTGFNSLIQIETNNGIPRNPFNNGGALVICDMLMSELKNPKQDFLDFVRQLADNDKISFSDKVAKSEASVGYRNIAMCNFIKSFGNIHNDPADVLDFYFSICSLEMSCKELTKTFMYLVDCDCSSKDERVLSKSKTKRVNAIMQTCGFYDESGEFTFRVGLPGKSGVGGGIIAIHPCKYSIAVWSPRLNPKGNSSRGMKFLELFTTVTESSIF